MNMPTSISTVASRSFSPFRIQNAAAALFQYIDRRFGSDCQTLHAGRNSLIFCQGSQIQYLYLVKEGEVLLKRGTPDGGETILSVLGPGEFFGESALLSGSAVSFSADTTKKTHLQLLSRSRFLALLEDPKASRTLLETIANRCDDAYSRMEVIGCTYAREKVRSGLLWLSERFGVETSKGIRINLNQTQLALMVGCARETLSREVNELKRMNAVDISSDNGHKAFYVLNPDNLAEFP